MSHEDRDMKVVRSMDAEDKVQVTLLMLRAKNRLSPTTPKLTVPKTELAATVMCIRLVKELKRELSVAINAVRYWTDSMKCFAI